MSEQSNIRRRPWWRLHVSTLIVLSLSAVVVAALIIPGEPAPPTDVIGPGLDTAFGWPWVYAHGLYYPMTERLALWSESTLWWPHELQADFGIRWGALSADFAIGLGILIVIAVIVERHTRSRGALYRFRLRDVLVVMLLMAMTASWLAQHRTWRQREKAALAKLEPLISYPGQQFVGPVWLKRLLPERWHSWFYHYTTLRLDCPEPAQIPVDVLSELTAMRTLIAYGEGWTDKEIRVAAQLPLHVLYLDSLAISEEGMAIVAAIPCLEYLNVSSVVPGDRGIDALANSGTLRGLRIDQSTVTADQVMRLAEVPHLLNVHISSVVFEPHNLPGLVARVQAARPSAKVMMEPQPGGRRYISWWTKE